MNVSNAPGFRSISDSESRRCLENLASIFGVPVGGEPPRGAFAELARKLGVSATAVGNWWHGRVTIGESAARAVAIEAGKKEHSWRDGDPQPETMVDRIVKACRDFGLDRSLEKELREHLLGGEMAAWAGADLPEPLKRAVLGAVHLLGYSIEDATREAISLAQDKGPEAPKYLDASEWYASLGARLLAKKPGSGTRPALSLVRSKPKK